MDDILISRQAVLNAIDAYKYLDGNDAIYRLKQWLNEQECATPKMGHCKDCKYFEYDSVAEVHGIPLIVAHEICKRWGDGCQSKEDGYCFLFEPRAEGSEE